MENSSNKIYSAKQGNQYYVGKKINYSNGKIEPITTLNVNYCKLMTAKEVKQVLETFPAFSSCIINSVNRLN